MVRRKVEKKKFAKTRIFRKRSCKLCLDKVSALDFKNVELISQFTSEKAKIVPRRISGACAKHQRLIAAAIKRARVAVLMPFEAE